MSSTDIPFGTRLIGQTEKTLNAILGHLLLGSGLTEAEWVALTVTINGGPAGTTVAAERVAAALKRSPAEGAEVLSTLRDRGLVGVEGGGDVLAATEQGRQFHAATHARISAITDRLWGDVPKPERETAAAVLNTVLERAATELAALGR